MSSVCRAMFIGIVYLAWFASGNIALSQELDSYFENALTNHPRIVSARDRLRSKSAQARMAGLWEDPMVGIEGEGFPTDSMDWGRFGDIEWSINQDLPFPGRRFLERKSAGCEVMIAMWDLEREKRELISQIKNAYLDYLLNGELIRIHQSHENWSGQILEIVQSQLRSAKASQQDVWDGEVEKGRVHLQIWELQKERKNALEMLRYFSHQKEIPPKMNPHLEWPSLKKDILSSLVDQSNPELKSLFFQVRKKERELELADFVGKPKFTLKAEARWLEGEGFEEYDVMAGMSVPWIWGSKRIRESRLAAQADRHEASQMYSDKANELKSEIKKTLVNLSTSQRVILLYESHLIPVAHSALEAALSKYRNSTESFFRVLDLRKKYLELEIEQIQERYRYFHEAVRVEAILGKDYLKWDSVEKRTDAEEVQNEK